MLSGRFNNPELSFKADGIRIARWQPTIEECLEADQSASHFIQSAEPCFGTIMVADLKKKVVFVHIPKCAGCSIEDWLGFKQDNRQSYKGSYPFGDRSRRCLSHLTAYELQQELTKPVFDRCFSFGVVRNPYDRMISEFYWLYAYDIGQIRSNRTGLNDSFNSFIEKLNQIRMDKTFIQNDIHFDHYEPQYTFLYHPVTGEQLVKNIGRVEYLESFLAEEVQPAIGNFFQQESCNISTR